MIIYEALCVMREAADEEIRRAYRMASMRVHPDHDGENGATQRALDEAFDVLLDIKRRSRYAVGGDTAPVQSLDGEEPSGLRQVFPGLRG